MSSGQNGVEVVTNGKAKVGNTPKPIIKETINGVTITPDRTAAVPKVFEGNDEILDPFCDPKQPQKISFHDITSAAFLIKDGVERTPCPVSY